jgi:hypothetical protein
VRHSRAHSHPCLCRQNLTLFWIVVVLGNTVSAKRGLLKTAVPPLITAGRVAAAERASTGIRLSDVASGISDCALQLLMSR